jgi:hypothetical protein
MATWIRSTTGTLHEFYKHTPAGTHQLISGDSWMVVSYFFFFFASPKHWLGVVTSAACQASPRMQLGASCLCVRPRLPTPPAYGSWAASKVASTKGLAPAYSQPRRESQLHKAALPHETLAAAILGWVLPSSQSLDSAPKVPAASASRVLTLPLCQFCGLRPLNLSCV